jgi:3-isopropylmalate dehydrogenase
MVDAVSRMGSEREFHLLALPGDGIGPAIITETLRVVEWFGDYLGIKFDVEYGLVGGASIDDCGEPLSAAAYQKAQTSNAILFGAVGGPKWDHLPRSDRPEMGILRLRQGLDLYANLRPAVCFPELVAASSLRAELVESIDIMIVRESTSGVYFGEPRGIEVGEDGLRRAVDTQAYNENEIARVCRVAFEIARQRGRRVCSVDKANVMETGVLWRQVASEIGLEFPDVQLSHMYADNCAMQLLREPKQFDVIVTDNLFGDILSDEAAALSGSLGLLPSATLNLNNPGQPGAALYEPIHGSAPDIIDMATANPIASILSFGMCLNYSLNSQAAADLLNQAVRRALARGLRTADIAVGESPVPGSIMTDEILTGLDEMAASRQETVAL